MGEPLAEIDTDKATMEMQALANGVLRKILINEGRVGATRSTDRGHRRAKRRHRFDASPKLRPARTGSKPKAEAGAPPAEEPPPPKPPPSRGCRSATAGNGRQAWSGADSGE